ncbi:hypothetical protein [Cupriavidus ulmosensis]
MNVVLDPAREADQQLLDSLQRLPDGMRMYVCRLVLQRGLVGLDEAAWAALIADASRDQVGRGRKRGPRPGSRKQVVVPRTAPAAAPPAAVDAPLVTTTTPSPAVIETANDTPATPPARMAAAATATAPAAAMPSVVTPEPPRSAPASLAQPQPVPVMPAPSRLGRLAGLGIGGP